MSGIVVFIAVFLVLAAAFFGGYKYLSNVSRFEDRKNTLKIGFFASFICVLCVLFMPIALFSIRGDLAEIAGNIPKIVSEIESEKLSENRAELTEKALNALLSQQQIPVTAEIEMKKVEAIILSEKAAEIAKNHTLSDSVKTAVSFFKIEREEEIDGGGFQKNLRQVLQVSDEQIERVCKNVFEPISQDALAQTTKNPLIPEKAKKIIEESDSASEYAEKTANYIVFSLIALAVAFAVLIAAIFAWAMILLRNPKIEREKNERARLFEFRNDIFEKINQR